jgi:hypothetical protein
MRKSYLVKSEMKDFYPGMAEPVGGAGDAQLPRIMADQKTAAATLLLATPDFHTFRRPCYLKQFYLETVAMEPLLLKHK